MILSTSKRQKEKKFYDRNWNWKKKHNSLNIEGGNPADVNTNTIKNFNINILCEKKHSLQNLNIILWIRNRENEKARAY